MYLASLGSKAAAVAIVAPVDDAIKIVFFPMRRPISIASAISCIQSLMLVRPIATCPRP